MQFYLICAQDPRVTVYRPVLSMVGPHHHLDAEDDGHAVEDLLSALYVRKM